LPLVVDAFCPRCRENLNDPPARSLLNPAGPTDAPPTSGIGKARATLFILGGLVGLGAGFVVGQNSLDRLVVWVPSLFAIVVGFWALSGSQGNQETK
jgi:hypothetical protein